MATKYMKKLLRSVVDGKAVSASWSSLPMATKYIRERELNGYP